MMSLVGGVLGAGASIYDTYIQRQTDTKARRLAKVMWGRQMAAYEESQQKVWGAYEAELARTKEFEAKQAKLYEPFQETQLAAMEKYRAAAEAPETSPYAKFRMEESEKAINKELARRGILFSGAAAELREKSRRNIMGEESERAKAMLQNLMTGITPVGPGFTGGPSMPGATGMPGIPVMGGSGVSGGGIGGATPAAQSIMAGVSGYQQTAGYEQAMGIQNPWYKVGLGIGTPTSPTTYGQGLGVGYAPGQWYN